MGDENSVMQNEYGMNEFSRSAYGGMAAKGGKSGPGLDISNVNASPIDKESIRSTSAKNRMD